MVGGSTKLSGKSSGRKWHLGETLNDNCNLDRQVGKGEEMSAKEIAFAKVNKRKMDLQSKGAAPGKARRSRKQSQGQGTEALNARLFTLNSVKRRCTFVPCLNSYIITS